MTINDKWQSQAFEELYKKLHDENGNPVSEMDQVKTEVQESLKLLGNDGFASLDYKDMKDLNTCLERDAFGDVAGVIACVKIVGTTLPGSSERGERLSKIGMQGFDSRYPIKIIFSQGDPNSRHNLSQNPFKIHGHTDKRPVRGTKVPGILTRG